MFEQISEEEIADAAFLMGVLQPGVLTGLKALPLKVDGLPTIGFCVEAAPVTDPSLKILHPVAIIPHRAMLIQDIRDGVSGPLSRVRVLPVNVRHAKLYRAAMEDPNTFFRA